MRKRAFCWDFDGTLVDSEQLHRRLQQQVCREAGILVPESEWEKFKCRRDSVAFAYAIERYSDNSVGVEALRKAKAELYAQYVRTQVGFVPGALEFLRQTRNLFPLLALVTTTQRRWVDLLFEVFDLHQYFDLVVTGDDVAKVKPDPAPYLVPCDRLGVHPSECFALEDSDIGVQSARNAGLTAIGITTSFPANVLWEAGAHHVVERFSEILPLINWGLSVPSA